MPQVYTLIPRAEADKTYGKLRGADGYSAQQGSAYGFKLENFLNMWGMPCWAPPYGTMSSYDLNTGKLLWRKPFGQVQKWGFYMPESWGSVTIGAPVITKIGYHLHRRLDGQPRARHRPEDRQCAVEAIVDAPAVAQPAVYTYKGKICRVRRRRQRHPDAALVRPAGGLRLAGQLMAG